MINIKFQKVHPQPPPAGDIAIDQVTAKLIVSDQLKFNNQNRYLYNL
jgi:hypothetical protein